MQNISFVDMADPEEPALHLSHVTSHKSNLWKGLVSDCYRWQLKTPEEGKNKILESNKSLAANKEEWWIYHFHFLFLITHSFPCLEKGQFPNPADRAFWQNKVLRIHLVGPWKNLSVHRKELVDVEELHGRTNFENADKRHFWTALTFSPHLPLSPQRGSPLTLWLHWERNQQRSASLRCSH